MNLQNRLRTLSSGLVGLRNCIHDQQQGNGTAAAMDVAVSYPENGLNRIPDPSQPHSSLNPEGIAFSNGANEGGNAVMNGVVSTNSVPPMTNCVSATFTSPTTGFHENGTNHGAQQPPQSHQFIHGKLLFLY